MQKLKPATEGAGGGSLNTKAETSPVNGSAGPGGARCCAFKPGARPPNLYVRSSNKHTN